MDAPQQPAVRVSWTDAAAFCRWLSERSGLTFDLPNEAAVGIRLPRRHGRPAELRRPRRRFLARRQRGRQGDRPAVFVHRRGRGAARDSLRRALRRPAQSSRRPSAATGPTPGGSSTCTATPPSGRVLTGGRIPSAMTRSRDAAAAAQRKIVRGGSFYDRPTRCRSAFRLDYPAWQAVHNVGFPRGVRRRRQSRLTPACDTAVPAVL